MKLATPFRTFTYFQRHGRPVLMSPNGINLRYILSVLSSVLIYGAIMLIRKSVIMHCVYYWWTVYQWSQFECQFESSLIQRMFYRHIPVFYHKSPTVYSLTITTMIAVTHVLELLCMLLYNMFDSRTSNHCNSWHCRLDDCCVVERRLERAGLSDTLLGCWVAQLLPLSLDFLALQHARCSVTSARRTPRNWTWIFMSWAGVSGRVINA